MTKPGQEGPAESLPPPWREESHVFPELSPGPEGHDVEDISPEKKRPELPWKKKGEERARQTQRHLEQPWASGPSSVLEQEEAVASGSLAELWGACDVPTGQGGPAQGRGVQWRADELGVARGGTTFWTEKEMVVRLPLEKNASVLLQMPASTSVSQRSSVCSLDQTRHHRGLTWHQIRSIPAPRRSFSHPPHPNAIVDQRWQKA